MSITLLTLFAMGGLQIEGLPGSVSTGQIRRQWTGDLLIHPYY